MEDHVVHVIGFDNNTKLIRASMSCDASMPPKEARYFRSIGYNARIVEPEMVEFYLNRDTELRREQMRLQNEAGIYDNTANN